MMAVCLHFKWRTYSLMTAALGVLILA